MEASTHRDNAYFKQSAQDEAADATRLAISLFISRTQLSIIAGQQ